MSAPHLGVTPEFWLFGFLPTVYTNDWKTGLALVLILEYAVSLFAVHAVDAVDAATCTELLWMTTTTHAMAVFLGAMVGLAFVFATDFPNVFNIDFYFSSVQRSRLLGGSLAVQAANRTIFRPSSDGFIGTPWKSKPYAWTFLGFGLPFIFIYTAILLFIGRFTMAGAYSISQGLSNALGALLVVLAVIGLTAYIVAVFRWPNSTRFPDGHDASGALNLKYGALLTLALITPVVFDFTSAWAAWARYALHIGVALLVYLLTVWLGRHDRYLGTEKLSRVYLVFFAIWIIHLSVYTASAFMTSQDAIFAWVAAWSVAWIIVLLIYGFVRRSNGAYSAALQAQNERRGKALGEKPASRVSLENVDDSRTEFNTRKRTTMKLLHAI